MNDRQCEHSLQRTKNNESNGTLKCYVLFDVPIAVGVDLFSLFPIFGALFLKELANHWYFE